MKNEARQSEKTRIENATKWAEEFAGWLRHGPNALLADWHVEVTGGKAVICLHGWDSHNAETLARAVRAHYGIELQARGTAETRRLFHVPTAPPFGYYRERLSARLA